MMCKINNMARRRCVASALVAVIMLAGCASAPPMRYHALMAIPQGRPEIAYDGPVLQVAQVRWPAEFDRVELHCETAPGRFEVSDADHWAAPLPRLSRQTLAEDLATRLPPGRTAFPGAAWPVAEAQLTVDILSYTRRDGVAAMSLSWSLRRGDATPTGAQWTLQVPAADEATAVSALLARFADRFVADLAAPGPGR